MRDYWLVKYLISAIGWAYVIVTLVAIGLALRYAKPLKSKIIATLVVLAIASILPIQGFQDYQQRKQSRAEFEERFDKAETLFDERCKTAGEKIYRTVEDVEGIVLTKIRDTDVAGNRANPLWEDAALPFESSGNWYIRSFLYYENHNDKRSPRGYTTNIPSNLPGYRYVDVPNANGSIDRYEFNTTGEREEPRKSIAPNKPTRYAVDFTNQVDPEDRKHWVAGTTITVTDTLTKEIIAQRTSFSFEPGLGSTGGYRQPWGYALTCPQTVTVSQTRFFVDQVLKPIRGK
jgi:hypothetical protein